MKIVRITIATQNNKFYFDRPFEEDMNDFENCDASMKFLTALYEQNKVLAVMLMTTGINVIEGEKAKHDPFYGAIPAMLNLGVAEYIAIENVGIYEQQ